MQYFIDLIKWLSHEATKEYCLWKCLVIGTMTQSDIYTFGLETHGVQRRCKDSPARALAKDILQIAGARWTCSAQENVTTSSFREFHKRRKLVTLLFYSYLMYWMLPKYNFLEIVVCSVGVSVLIATKIYFFPAVLIVDNSYCRKLNLTAMLIPQHREAFPSKTLFCQQELCNHLM